MKPHWEWMHEEWMSDFKFWLETYYEFKMLARKNIENEMNGYYISMMKTSDKMIKKLSSLYKKQYGSNPNLRGVRKNAEETAENQFRRTYKSNVSGAR